MNYSIMNVVQLMSGNSTIPADKTNLSTGTVASVVITGIAVVFIGLVLLIAFVSIYGKVFQAINASQDKKKREKEEAALKAAAPQKPVIKQSPPAEKPKIEDGIEEETVAVIMAAIAAMSASSGKKMVLKSVKTAKPQRPAWSTAGVIENTRPF